MATYSRILAWKIPWTEEPGRLQSMGLKRVGHDWVTSLHSVYKLNKQGENIQPWCTPFPIWNKSIVSCLVLNVASWPAYRFLRRQVRWSNFPQFIVMHTVKGFSIVNEAEIDIFLEFPWFVYDPMNVGNLISGSSASLKPSLYIWKFSVDIPLKPSLKNFMYNLANMWTEYNCMVV